MRNNPKVQRWEKSKTILGGQRGGSTGVGCVRRVGRSSQLPWCRGGGSWFWGGVPPNAPITISPLCPPLRIPAAPEHPGSIRTSDWAAWQGRREREEHRPRRAGEHMPGHNLALPNYPAWRDFVQLPPSRLPSIFRDYLVQRWRGETIREVGGLEASL